MALLAPWLQEAVQKFDRQATDADLHAFIAPRSAGNDVLLPPPIVVCPAQQERPAVNDAGLLRRIAHAVGHLFVRAA